ncbi:MAG TPA: hypothetical protein VGO21_04840 [Candidatus Paceibacterota bacterium]|nr:hypothetical protein [Candidatus Paceibacterota bacterium]
MENYSVVEWHYNIFRSGKYLDLWSVNHTLAGIVIAGPLYYFSVPFMYSLFISLALIVGWEIYEIVFDIYETWQNRSTDIITGLVGFFFVWHFYLFFNVGLKIWIYFLSLFLFLVLEIWGYFAYQAGVR